MKTPISPPLNAEDTSNFLEWCQRESMPDLETVWAKCPRGDWLLWLAEKRHADPVKLAGYTAKRASLDANYYSGHSKLTADWQAKRDAVVAEFSPIGGQNYDAYTRRVFPVDAAYYARREPLYSRWQSEAADLMRSLFPGLP